jgi:hypothetical protein
MRLRQEYSEIISSNFEVSPDLHPAGEYLQDLSKQLSDEESIPLSAFAKFYTGEVETNS